jgi:nitroreductase
MTFLELARRRQSVRGYLPQPVERDKIERCLEAARLAPSASNAQPWRFVVADDPRLVREVGRATYKRFTRSAPAFVAVVREPGKAESRVGGWLAGRDYRLIDLGMAAEHFCLQAAEEGLGTCLLGFFNSRRVGKLLRVPLGRRVQILITLGYPADAEVREKRRKPLAQVRSYNRYGGSSVGPHQR